MLFLDGVNMKNRVVIPVVVALVSQASYVAAAEYVIGAKFSPTFSYDDNVRLREDKKGSFLTKIQPTLTLSRAEATSRILLNTGLRVERYTSLKELDREDPFINFSSSYNTERSVYSLTASYSEDAQRSIADEDTGNFSSNATVESINLSPSYQYQLTEKDFVHISLNYSERKYSSDSRNPLDYVNNLSDNETTSLTTGWTRKFTERLSGGVALTYAQYEAESSFQDSEYDTFNYALNASYLLSEKWSLSGQVGYRTLDNEIRPVGSNLKLTDNSSGTLFNFAANYQKEINDFSLSLGRSLNPSGEGVVNEQDRITVNWRRGLSDTLSFSLNTSYQETQTADSINQTDREYFIITPSMKWDLDNNLSLNFGYQYRQQKGTTVDSVDGNMVYLTVGYDWNGLRYSR